MKKIRKLTLMLLLSVLTLALGIFASACGGKKLKVSFDTDGAGELASLSVAAGEEITLPDNLTKDGYVFDGWYDNADKTGTQYKNPVKIDKDTTFYAKWIRGFNLTLDLDGGEYNGDTTATIMVGVGKPILKARWQGSALEDAEPYKGSLQFGAWFAEDDSEVTESSVMPQRDITIKAKYKVYYTIELHKQAEPRSKDYPVDETDYRNDLGYVNESMTVAAPTVEHYTFNSAHKENLVTLTLSENTSDNKFILYYDRATYRIIYNVNAPANTEAEGNMRDTTFVYGEQGEIARNKFEIEGYRLAGWATSASGEIAFQSGDKLEEGNYNLYAVWDRGYRDLLGGTDHIFFPRNYGGKVILLRAGYELEGTRKSLSGDTYTDDPNGEYIDFGKNLIAKLDSNNMTFVFFYADRKGEYKHISTYEDVENPFANDAKLELDGFEKATLTEGGQTKDCTYYYDKESGQYKLNVSGEKEPRAFIFGLQDETKVFTFLGEEAGEHVVYQRTGITGYLPMSWTIKFDGVGGVQLLDYETKEMLAEGVYKTPKEVGSGNLMFPYVHSIIEGLNYEVYLTEFTASTGERIPGAILKDDGLTGTFKNEAGDTIKVDGFNGFAGCAKYTKSGEAEQEFDFYAEYTMVGTVLHLLNDAPDQKQEEVAKYILNAVELNADGTVKEGKFEDYRQFTEYYTFGPAGESYNTYTTAYTLVIFDGEGSEVEFTETIKEVVDDPESETGKKAVEKQVQMKGYKAKYFTPNGSMDGYVTWGKDAALYNNYYHLDPNPLYHFEAVIDDADKDNEEIKEKMKAGEYKGTYCSFEFQKLENLQTSTGATLNVFYMYRSRDKYPGGFNYAVYDTKPRDDGKVEKMFVTYNLLVTARGSDFEGIGAYYLPGDGTYIEGSLEPIEMDRRIVEMGLFKSVQMYSFFYYDDMLNLQEKHFQLIVEGNLGYIEFFDYAPVCMFETKQITRNVGRLTLQEDYVGMVFDSDGKTAYYFPSSSAFTAQDYIKGTYTYLEDTQLGGMRYSFTPDDESETAPFEFIRESVRNGQSYSESFRMLNKKWQDYSAVLDDGSTVTLDGFGHYARYALESGESLEGHYIFFTDENDKYQQLAIYTQDEASSILIRAGIATDEDGNLLTLTPEERVDWFYFFASAGGFPQGFDQAIVVFNSNDGTFEIPQYGDWEWYMDYLDDVIHSSSWDPNEYYTNMYCKGTYQLLDADDLIYVLHCNMLSGGIETGEKRDYIVKMTFTEREGLLTIQDDEYIGSYLGENNEAVYIDGYGLSFFVDAFGNRRDGIYTFISKNYQDDKYRYIAFDDGDVCYVMVVNLETRTFTIGNKEKDFLTYYSDDFDAVEFTDIFSINGNGFGYWFFDSSDEGKFKLYEAIFDDSLGWQFEESKKYSYPANAEEQITVDGKTYYKCEKGKTYTFNGSIVFDAFVDRKDLKDGAQTKWTGMTLEFTPDGSNELNAPAKLTFKHGNETEVFDTYTVKKEVVSVLQAKTATIIKLYPKNAAYGYRLDLNRNPQNGEDGFVLHAAASDTILPDYYASIQGGVSYATISCGRNYSIGYKSWPLTDWIETDVANELIVSIVMNAADRKGKILTADVLYTETFEEAKEGSTKKGGHKITTDKNLGVENPVWEVPMKGSDGYDYSAWIEMFSAAANGNSNLSNFYCVFLLSVKKTFETKIGEISGYDVENGTFADATGEEVTVTTHQFECAYWGALQYGSVYTIGIVSKDDPNKSYIQETSYGHWVDDLIILYDCDIEGENDKPADKQPECYVVKVKQNADGIIESARIDKSVFKTFASDIKVKKDPVISGGQTTQDETEYEQFYIGFIQGVGHNGSLEKDTLKDYLAYVAVFNTETGKYVKAAFYGNVEVNKDMTKYDVSYTLGTSSTVWRITVTVERNEDGSINSVKVSSPT